MAMVACGIQIDGAGNKDSVGPGKRPSGTKYNVLSIERFRKARAHNN